MNTRALTLSLSLLLALGGCDGDPSDMPMNDAGPSGGADSGELPPGSDAGPMTTGPGSCPATLPEVSIQFGGCDALNACGGDPTGVWVYEAVCIEDPTPDLTGVCPQARVEDLSGTARGCVALDGSRVTRDVSGETSWTVVVPESCTFGAGCAAIESAIGVTCTLDSGDCRCPMGTTFGTSDADDYTIAGSVLTTGDGGQYDFCVAGSELRYEERDEMADEPGIATLSR